MQQQRSRRKLWPRQRHSALDAFRRIRQRGSGSGGRGGLNSEGMPDFSDSQITMDELIIPVGVSRNPVVPPWLAASVRQKCCPPSSCKWSNALDLTMLF